MLEVLNLSKRFGGLRAVWDLSFAVEEGDVLGVIGPNGAGKTTLLNLITGYLAPDSGDIRFEGKPIGGIRPFQICRMGIGRTFQIVQPFAEMSVEDNVVAATLFSAKRYVSVNEGRKRAQFPLELTGLWASRHQLAGTLSIGNKKKLELARALAVRPRLLLLDEVMGGLSGPEIVEIVEVLERIHKRGTTILMIEHLVEVMLRMTRRILVLNFGEKLFEGPPNEVVEHPAVIETYLGRPLEVARNDQAVR